MRSGKLLFVGAFLVAAFLAITAAIIAIAPYMAVILIMAGFVWFFGPKDESPEE